MSDDLFANPFSLTNKDQRKLNNFFDADGQDDDGYEQVSASDVDDEEDEEQGEYEAVGPHDSRRTSRRQRRHQDETIGDLLPNMFSSNRSSGSLKVIYLAVIGCLMFFLVAYFGLHAHQEKVLLEGSSKIDGDTDSDDINNIMGGVEDGDEEEVGPPLTYNADDTNKATMFTFDTKPKTNFDPFQLHPTKIKEQNEWLGAPFVVTPPQLPTVTDDNEEDANDDNVGPRLGYFQYPTIVNGTIVFSTEGDLYLTRLPDKMPSNNKMAPLAAMKLTNTVGNALHPKLNPKFQHLLAYSATYSGTREVYLMDLRPTTASSSHGAPGTPGGPALRLTYTPGGIRSVVGWDDDGTSILYSAWSCDVKSLPDNRLYRLRLSWGSGDGGSSEKDGDASKDVGEEKKDEDVLDANESEDESGSNDQRTSNEQQQSEDNDEKDDDDDYSVAEAQSYVDEIAGGDESSDEESNDTNDSSSTDTKNGDKEEDNDRHKRMLERQKRRHLAKLSSAKSRRKLSMGTTHSIIEPIPLAQATEGVYHKSSGCVYFTRFKQSSSTKRYVGGTAESLWAYCPDRFNDLAIPLTSDYNGTSKSPSIYTHDDFDDVLFFMSDRAPVQSGSGEATEWIASSMDLWAVFLPVSSSGSLGTPKRLTNVACQNNGIDLSEYAIDPTSGGVVLRIGADLHFMSFESVQEKLSSSSKKEPNHRSITQQLLIAVYSDFSNMQERLLPLQIPNHITTLDAYETPYGVSTLLTARGQTFVAPVISDTKSILLTAYGGGGRNMPARRYKVAPGTGGGGLVRILAAKHVPQPSVTSSPLDSGERLALILATDPLSPTGEHAFYLIRTDAMASPAFGFAALYEYGDTVTDTGLPAPFIGGHLASGGSTREGGLGSVYGDSIAVSPCGRRFAFTDTDGRIVVITIPTAPVKTESGRNLGDVNKIVLPQENEVRQPLIGSSGTELVWSPGGRYLAIVHSAKNQFRVISIADLGLPETGSIDLGRIVQATTDRFNSFSPVWGRASKDIMAELFAAALDPTKASSGSGGADALIFLSDRDVKLAGNNKSPWGTRAPSPYFDGYTCVHVLPLQSIEDALDQNAISKYINAPYGGGGAEEVAMKGVQELSFLLEAIQKQQAAASSDSGGTSLISDVAQNSTEQSSNTSNTTDGNSTGAADTDHPFIIDTEISFGEVKDVSFSFARSSYRIDHIPAGGYLEIVCQLADDPSLVLLTEDGLKLMAIEDWPNDGTEALPTPAEQKLQHVGMSSDGQQLLTIQNGKLTVTPRTAKAAAAFFGDTELEKNVADVDGLHMNIFPSLEFQQIYKDAWRLLRDYFYDIELHQVPWDSVFNRYLPLVERCAKREELDDVLRQMIGELSALHSFVYGGEYSHPHHGDETLEAVNEVGSLGATLQRSPEKGGYLAVDIPERDEDFHMIDGLPMYSPLSDQVLKLSGQAGLNPGDIILSVNGENVLDLPDIHMLLRNTAGQSVRLDVLRIVSTSPHRQLQKMKERILQRNDNVENEAIQPEPLIVVPLTSDDSEDLNYAAWEWKTRKSVKSLSAAAGFSCGYAHVQSMSGASAIDSFVRGFYPDYDKDALIIDVRNNRGGNIDSWLLDTLQRKAWMYWESRESNITTGGLGWDMQFAFRGHIVVLINEHTSSDGEGFARGVSELGLGKLVGKRTWGGGIWLSSDNHLVDGGIASAPEVGTYNDKFGWGLGIEQMGVMPDVEVDNNPRAAYDGEDAQLERAISVLKEWLDEEPVVLPKKPGPRKDMSKREGVDGCSV